MATGVFPSISLKLTFAVAFSLSLAAFSSSRNVHFVPKISLKSSLSSSSPYPRDLAADILSLLGSQRDAARIPVEEADEIRSCLRFLAPFVNLPERPNRRELLADIEEEDEMVRWPPPPVMELARLAVDSGGDPASIQRSLDPTVLKVSLSQRLDFSPAPKAYDFATRGQCK